MSKFWICAVALSLLAVAVVAQDPPSDPEARKTWVANEREKAAQRQAEFLSLPPEEQERIKAERRAERAARRAAAGFGPDGRRVRPMRLAEPLPLPVALGGEPAGEACAAGGSCRLTLDVPEGKVLVLTSVWGASRLRCDEVMTATPGDGSPVSPWWRCTSRLEIQGTGAGYVGYLTAK